MSIKLILENIYGFYFYQTKMYFFVFVYYLLINCTILKLIIGCVIFQVEFHSHSVFIVPQSRKYFFGERKLPLQGNGVPSHHIINKGDNVYFGEKLSLQGNGVP